MDWELRLVLWVPSKGRLFGPAYSIAGQFDPVHASLSGSEEIADTRQVRLLCSVEVS